MMKRTLIYKLIYWPLLAMLVVLPFVSNAQQAKKDTANTPQKAAVIFKDTLFYIYSNLGPYSPQDRAVAAENRIKQLMESSTATPDSFHVADNDLTSDIMYGRHVIVSVTKDDAAAQKSSREAIAKTYLTTLSMRLKAERIAKSWQSIALHVFYALVVLFLLYLAVHYFNKLYQWVLNNVLKLKGVVLKGIKVKNLELLTPSRQVSLLLGALKVVRYFIILLLSYLALVSVFSILPWTRWIAGKLLGYILNPFLRIVHAIVNYIPNILTILVIYLITRYIIRFIRFIALEVEKGTLRIQGFHTEWAKPTFNIIRFLLYVFMFTLIFPYLPGANSPVFQGVSVFIGVLISFGSTSAIANILAGMIITYMRPFKIGERVKIGDVLGDVVEKNLLVTRVRTIKNEDITIPNSTVLSSYTTNFSSSSKDLGLILHTEVTIGYDAPWRQVHQLLADAALKTADVLQTPAPFVLQSSLDDFYVTYQINAYTREPNRMATIYSELHQNIQDKFYEAGVEIMSPNYQSIRDGNEVAIPPEKRPANYQAPAFKVKNQEDNQPPAPQAPTTPPPAPPPSEPQQGG